MRVYEVATNHGVERMDVDQFTERYELIGFENNPRVREELQGEYKVNGLNGPMYGGKKDGITVIRYEEPAHYATYD